MRHAEVIVWHTPKDGPVPDRTRLLVAVEFEIDGDQYTEVMEAHWVDLEWCGTETGLLAGGDVKAWARYPNGPSVAMVETGALQ